MKFGELQSISYVRRLFGKQFPQHSPFGKAFSRVVERFKETGNVQSKKAPGTKKFRLQRRRLTWSGS